MKEKRQAAILQIIRDKEIYSQAELTRELAAAGYKSAQATTSRDIRELRLTMETTPDGQRRYATPDLEAETMRRVFRDGITSLTHAGNMLVIKTMSGLAMAVAVVLDDMKIPEILGSVAGDDVVICVVSTPAAAAKLAKSLKSC